MGPRRGVRLVESSVAPLMDLRSAAGFYCPTFNKISILLKVPLNGLEEIGGDYLVLQCH